MRYSLMNSGRRVEAEFSEENIREIFLPVLRRLTALHRRKGRRVLALLAAPPAAGKSTLAALLERLSREDDALADVTALGMDGFHHPQAWLRSHFTPEGAPLLAVKGAPETFDLPRLRAALARVAAGEDCPWPAYDRTLHDPVADALRVTGPIALVEGNYLLLDAPGWRELCRLADFTLFIGAEPELLRRRLIARHVAGGRSPEAAEAFVESSDMANARLCLQRALPADLRLALLPDGSYADATPDPGAAPVPPAACPRPG